MILHRKISYIEEHYTYQNIDCVISIPYNKISWSPRSQVGRRKSVHTFLGVGVLGYYPQNQVNTLFPDTRGHFQLNAAEFAS